MYSGTTGTGRRRAEDKIIYRGITKGAPRGGDLRLAVVRGVLQDDTTGMTTER